MSNGLDVVKLGKEVHYIEVDYSELEWIVEAFYPDFFHEYGHPDWETDNIVSENEWNNDSKETIFLGENDEWEVEDFLNNPEKWKAEWRQYENWNYPKLRPCYYAFLEDLWNLGIIEHDEFLVDVCW